MNGNMTIGSNLIGINTNKERTINVAKYQVLPATNIRTPKMLEKLEYQGNPSVGTVIYFPSLHMGDCISDEHVLHIGKIHVEIIKEMEKRGIRHVFEESRCYDAPTTPTSITNGWSDREKESKRELDRWAMERKEAIFRQDLDLIDKDILMNIGGNGAASEYKFMNQDVYLHKTCTCEELESIMKETGDIIKKQKTDISIAEHQDLYKRYEYLVLDKREEFAVKQIMAFLKDNPGTKAALIFGSGHNFNDVFIDPIKHPRLISVKFPELDLAFYKIPYRTNMSNNQNFINTIHNNTNK